MISSTEIQELRHDLPEEAVALVEQAAKVKRIVEAIRIPIARKAGETMLAVTDYEIINQSRMLRTEYTHLMMSYLIILRKHFNKIYERKFTLPKLLKYRDYQQEQAKTAGVDLTEEERRRLTVSDSEKEKENLFLYLQEIMVDVQTKQTLLSKIEVSGMLISSAQSAMQYLSEIDLFCEQVAFYVKQSRKEWYQEAKITPYEEQKEKLSLLKETLNWRLNSLNQASAELYTYLYEKPFTKDPAFITWAATKITSIYQQKVYGLIDDTAVVKFHSSENYQHLNTILSLTHQHYTKEPIFEQFAEIGSFQTEENASGTEGGVAQQQLIRANQLLSSVYENRISTLIKYSEEDPFKGEIEKKTTPEERRKLLTGPTEKEHLLFWGILLSNIVAGPGAAAYYIKKSGEK